MATRRQRFLKHRQRARNRAERWRANNRTKPTGPPFISHGGGKPWEFKNTRPFAASNCPAPVNPPHTFHYGVPFNHGVISKPARGRWPYAALTDAALIFIRNHHGHFELPIIGFVKRRPLYRGHKKGRMNGFQRRVMGATWFALENGFYPEWDPLQRDPRPEDVDKDPDAAIDIEWRWGVLGHF